MADRVIRYDSPEAATYRTGLEGWVSGSGQFWGEDEHMARYDGCTHTLCKRCGAVVHKGYMYCSDCRNAVDIEQYKLRHKKPWDGKSVLYSEHADKYFDDIESAEESLEEGETLADLRLMICVPNYARSLDADYFCDEMDAEGELPAKVEAAIEAFNEAVSGIILSWSPSDHALELPTG